MAWNEPGNDGNGRGGRGSRDDNDPWGGGRRGGDQGPPDIDEVIRNLSKKLNDLFGGSGGFGGGNSSGSSSSGGRSPRSGRSSAAILGLLAVVVLTVWFALGIRQINEAERGVVLRFGRVLDAVMEPGIRWNPPLIDEVHRVNVLELNTKTYENRAMLTTDENIIDIAVTVQYRIQSPIKYVIAVSDPERSLDNAAESAIRHVVGGNFMDQTLTTGRALVANDVKERLQGYMDTYDTGILVVQVNVANAQPPDAVRPAFDDVIRAREDEQQVQNQARQYANRIIPEARGEAQSQIEQSNAYKQEVIAKATGDASRFSQLLEEYQKAPQVTRQRLYIDSIQDVLSASSKIMIDVEGGSNMLYVPLDKILEHSGSALGPNRPATAQEWRALADELAPYLPGPSGSTAVNSSRVNTTTRGSRQ
ncbi:MAG: FtsH protease activity modulator HflK [Pseudohongiellaceae bacterium]